MVERDPGERRRVAEAAYFRWLHRGCAHGGDQEDWFIAEQELARKQVSNDALASARQVTKAALAFFQRNPPAPHDVDVLFCGVGSRASQACVFAGLVASATDQSEAPGFERVLLVIPPGALDVPPEQVLSGLFHPSIAARVVVRQASQASPRRLLRELESSEGSTAVVVACADLFRSAEAGPAPRRPAARTPFGETLRVGVHEDEWLPSLAHFVTAAKGVASRKPLYVLLHVAQAKPAAGAHIDRLMTECDAVGEFRSPNAHTVSADTVREWIDRALSGRTDEVLTEVDRAPLHASDKAALKIQLLLSRNLIAEAESVALDSLEDLQQAEHSAMDALLARVALSAGRSEDARRYAVTALARQYIDETTLRELFRIARILGDEDLEDTLGQALSTRFPESAFSLQLQAFRLVRQSDYEAAAALLDDHRGEGARPGQLQYLHLLCRELAANPTELAAVVDRVASAVPEYRAAAVVDCVAYAARAGAVVPAVDLLWASRRSPDVLEAAADNAVGLLRRCLNEARLAKAQERNAYLESAVQCILFAAGHLAENPTSETRLRLAAFLLPEDSGKLGLVALVAALLRCLPGGETVTDVEGEPAGLDEFAEFTESYARYRATLSAPAEPLAGRSLPASVLNRERAVSLLNSAHRTVTAFGHHVREPGGEAGLLAALKIGLDVAETAHHEAAAGTLVGLGASALAVAGAFQRARDLAEHGLMLSKGRSAEFRRVAWVAFSDVYARCNSRVEACLGWLCASHLPVALSREDAFHERTLVVRLLRGVGFLDEAVRVLASAEELFPTAEVESSQKRRVAHLRASIHLLRAHDQPAALDDAIKELASTLLSEIKRGDLPVVTLAAEVLRLEERIGRTPDSDSLAIRQAFVLLPSHAEFARILSGTPSEEDIAAMLASVGQAHSAEDLARDAYALNILAKRRLGELVQSSTTRAGAFLVVEACGGHALTAIGDTRPQADNLQDQVRKWEMEQAISDAGRLPLAAASPRRTGGLLSQPSDVESVLKALCEVGCAIESFAFDDRERLVRVSCASDMQWGVFTEQVDLEHLRAWLRLYPHGINALRGANAITGVLQAISGFALSEMAVGSPVIITATPLLARLPHHLLLADHDNLGVRSPSCLAPSFSWLSSSMRATTASRGGAIAWVLPHDEAGLSALAIVGQSLREVAAKHQLSVIADPELPPRVLPVDLAIVAAHGALGAGDEFLVRVAGEDETRYAARGLAENLRRARVVVLAVCSGGRLDTEHFSNRLTGLPLELLERGTRAVVASPWTLSAPHAARWLKHFLELWDSNLPIADCVYQANEASRALHEPADFLAMHLYGDPFQSKCASSGAPLA